MTATTSTLTLADAPVQTSSATVSPRLDLLRVMAHSREGDRREAILFRQGRAWLQVPGAGHEALAALVPHLRPTDYLYPYYRERAMMLARGISNYQIALALFGKAESCSAGRQMSNHYSDAQKRVVASATLTGLQCLPAAGTAWACRRGGSGDVVICCIGDAATRQGEFYEALCFALQENLPLIFVVEDNGYGISTPTGEMTPWNIGALNNARRTLVNGRDALEVGEKSRLAIEAARRGEPQVLWCEMDRLLSHTASEDHRVYRTGADIEAMSARDPITLLKNRLIDDGDLTEEDWQAELDSIAQDVDEDYQRAERAPNPDPQSAREHLFSAVPSAPQTSGLAAKDDWTIVTALNATLHDALAEDEKILVFGEDVEDPKGGVFGVTKGLSTEFEGRVVNSPLAEATIAGVAVGLAVAGWRPLFEFQFIDFVGPAFNQIVNQIATLRWRSAGEWKCPMVLLAPCGAYLPAGGPWHSQTNEAWFAHTPGLQIVMPSTPEDAAALLRVALAGDDPVLFLLPKHLFRQRFAMSGEETVNIGEAAVRVAGSDVTLVAWGNCVELCESAAAQMEDEASIEVLDLRSIVPCDWTAVEKSLAKTGRLVVVQEDNRTCGFGQAVITAMTSSPQRWNLFAAPPQLVARDDVHMPFHPILEEAVLPSVEDICGAVRLTMNY